MVLMTQKRINLHDTAPLYSTDDGIDFGAPRFYIQIYLLNNSSSENLLFLNTKGKSSLKTT